MKRLRLLPAIALAVVMVVVESTAAAAQAPIHEPASPLDSTFGAGEVCAFPIHLESIGDPGNVTTFPDGHQLVTGRFIVRATNLLTEESILINASGPFVVRFENDGTTIFDVHGTFLWILGSGDLGGPGLLFTTGHVVTILSQEFLVTSFQLTGTSENLCTTLAA
jgi:hypothetical protein